MIVGFAIAVVIVPRLTSVHFLGSNRPHTNTPLAVFAGPNPRFARQTRYRSWIENNTSIRTIEAVFGFPIDTLPLILSRERALVTGIRLARGIVIGPITRILITICIGSWIRAVLLRLTRIRSPFRRSGNRTRGRTFRPFARSAFAGLTLHSLDRHQTATGAKRRDQKQGKRSNTRSLPSSQVHQVVIRVHTRSLGKSSGLREEKKAEEPS